MRSVSKAPSVVVGLLLLTSMVTPVAASPASGPPVAVPAVASLVRKPLMEAEATLPEQPGGARSASAASADESVPLLPGAPGRKVATEQARMVGLSWSGVKPDRVEIRSQNLDGSWTPWLAVSFTDGAEPGAAPPATTEPAWIGDASAFETRATRDGQDVTSELTALLVTTPSKAFDSKPAAITSGKTTRRSAVLPGTSTDPSDASPFAEAALAPGAGSLAPSVLNMTTPMPIFSRGDWGADESLRGSSPSYGPGLRSAVVHHTDTTNNYQPNDVPAQIRGFYVYHVQGNGWADIGYNALVDRFGRVWEGRYGGLDLNVVGAHALGFNSNSFGISMIGTFDSVPPSPLQEAVAQMIAWKFRLNGITDPKGSVQLTAQADGTLWPRGTVVTKSRIIGHRDVNSTTCPGTGGYVALPWIRDRAQHIQATNPWGNGVPPILTSGQSVMSFMNGYRLTMQHDGNLVLYDSRSQPTWASMTFGAGNYLRVQADGNVVIYDRYNQPVWHLGITGKGNYMRVQDDSNLVVYASNGRPLWDSKGYVGARSYTF